MAREFDSPWKETLAIFFERFVSFFFPELHDQIDWAEPPVSLDKELQSIMREAEIGEARVDNLTRVRLKTGDFAWLYIHVEVQSQHDARLAERIFIYHIRLFDLYGRHPVNLVILGDDSPAWRPSEYNIPHLGQTIRLPFLTAKLLDLADRIGELEQHPNPIGLMVAAHLESLLTGNDPEQRLTAKLRLVRRLTDRGASPEDIRQMYRLVDWFLDLPSELTQRFREGVDVIQQEKRMPYLTSTEQFCMDQGESKGLREVLEPTLAARFDDAGRIFAEETLPNLNLKALRRLKDVIWKAPSVEHLRELVAEPTSD
ncbi:RpnC/YadD family protein [Zavarzinella formosa]|uniref:hypothetical protein n=1 Tax=Zavarzinella formosa TaxID=360055 RepID=UPI0002D97C92|nr:hypothetical protein [Zavarzinella formosa]